MTTNPYPGREHGVGNLDYTVEDGTYDRWRYSRLAMLEYGEAELMYDIPRIVGGGQFANLGHARGGSAVLLADGIKRRGLKGHVHSVDTFSEFSSQYDKAVRTVKEYGLDDTVTVSKGRTDDVGTKLLNDGARFDFLFIDADHSYEGVKSDFLLWSQMLNSGGLVAFHDTNQAFTHDVIMKYVLNDSWQELKHLHVNRIRVFKKV